MTIVLPNSIEWVQAVLARWKLGAVPQPLSARLPDAEFEALLELRPRALIVGRDDPRGEITQRASGFHARSGAVRRRAARGGVAGVEVDGVGRQHRRPKLIEAGGDSRFPAAAGYPLGRAGGRRQPGLGAAEPQHRLHHVRRSGWCRATTWC